MQVYENGANDFPLFQIDQSAGVIHPVAAYANVSLNAMTDSWSAAEWWVTPTPALAGDSPLARIAEGSLTKDDVDRALPIEAAPEAHHSGAAGPQS